MWYDQWLSKSVKVKNAVSATYLLLFYNTKKQVTLQFTVHWVQCRMWPFSFRNTRLYWDILVLFRFLAVISPHSENNQSFNIGLTGRRCHKIQCQLRQSLVPGLAIQPKLSLDFSGHFQGEPGLADAYWSKGVWWRSVGDNWSYKSCKAPVKSSPPTNQHPVFLQSRCPSCHPTNSVKALKGKVSHSGVFQLCLWPLIAPVYLGGGFPCHSSALWCQYPKTVKTVWHNLWCVKLHRQVKQQTWAFHIDDY